MTNPNMASNQVSLPLHAVQAADLAVFLSGLDAQTAAFYVLLALQRNPANWSCSPDLRGWRGLSSG